MGAAGGVDGVDRGQLLDGGEIVMVLVTVFHHEYRIDHRLGRWVWCGQGGGVEVTHGEDGEVGQQEHERRGAGENLLEEPDGGGVHLPRHR